MNFIKIFGKNCKTSDFVLQFCKNTAIKNYSKFIIFAFKIKKFYVLSEMEKFLAFILH